MQNQTTRRELLRGGLAVAGFSICGIPEWILPALAQAEIIVPFTDIPENFDGPIYDQGVFGSEPDHTSSSKTKEILKAVGTAILEAPKYMHHIDFDC